MTRVRVVPDASVAAKWLVPEEGSERARLLLEGALEGTVRFSVPELWFVEIASVLWKRCRRGEFDRADGFEMLDRLTALPVRVHGHRALTAPAFDVAARTGITVYDALYAVLALRDRAVFVTADERLVRALASLDYRIEVRLLSDVESILST